MSQRKVALLQPLTSKREAFPKGMVFFVADELADTLYLTKTDWQADLVKLGNAQADLVASVSEVRSLDE